MSVGRMGIVLMAAYAHVIVSVSSMKALHPVSWILIAHHADAMMVPAHQCADVRQMPNVLAASSAVLMESVCPHVASI